MKNKAAVELGRKSAEKRGLNNMSPEEKSAYMRLVRQGKSPLKQEVMPVSDR